MMIYLICTALTPNLYTVVHLEIDRGCVRLGHNFTVTLRALDIALARDSESL